MIVRAPPLSFASIFASGQVCVNICVPIFLLLQERFRSVLRQNLRRADSLIAYIYFCFRSVFGRLCVNICAIFFLATGALPVCFVSIFAPFSFLFQERFRSVSRQYLRRADGLIVLYDVTREQSFIGVRKWIQIATDGIGAGASAKTLSDGALMNSRMDAPAIAIVGGSKFWG